VVGLAVITEGPSELDQFGVPRDEHPTLAGRDRLRRCERPDACVTPRPRTAAVPGRAVRVGAILDQDDARSPTEGGDSLRVEGDVTADVDEHHGVRLVPVGLALEVVE